MQVFSAVVASDHPKETLFGCPRGQINGRNAVLKAGSPIRWPFDSHGNLAKVRGVHVMPLICPSPISNVRTFSDDGRSQWINVLIPGFGRCQVQRSNLTFYQELGDNGGAHGALTSLTIRLSRSYGSTVDGIPQFLRAAGTSLKWLEVDVGDVHLTIPSCPNMEELVVHAGSVQARFKFDYFHTYHLPLPAISTHWEKNSLLAQELSISNSPIAMSLYWLQIHLKRPYQDIYGRQRGDVHNAQQDLGALLAMLDANQRLEHLDVVAPSAYQQYVGPFTRHNRKPLARRHKPLDVEAKAAFLSVLSARQTPNYLHKKRKTKASVTTPLDELTLANIFVFAGTPVFHQISFRVTSA